MSAFNEPNMTNLLEGLLISVSIRLDEEESTLKMVAGMLKNAREYTDLEEKMEKEVLENPRLRETTSIPEAVKSSGDAAYADRAAAWEQALSFGPTLRNLAYLVENYGKVIRETEDLGLNHDEKDINDLLVWLKECLEEHKLKLKLVRQFIDNAMHAETYMEDRDPHFWERRFRLPKATPKNMALKAIMCEEFIAAERYAKQLLRGIMKMRTRINEYRFKISHPGQDFSTIDLTNLTN